MTTRDDNGGDEDRGYDPGPEPSGDGREIAGYDSGPEPDGDESTNDEEG